MGFIISIPTPLEYFESLVTSDDEFPLIETAISLAQDEYPDLDVQQVLSQIDQMQLRLQRRVAQDASALQRLRAVNEFFFRDLGFSGNLNNYYDPDNSFIHLVLKSRRAIPITLALIWLELAQSVKLKAFGIGFPGHFMVSVIMPNGQVVIDPMDGQSLGREELSERLMPYLDNKSTDRTEETFLRELIKRAVPREIIARMLRNLKEIHLSQEDWIRLLPVHDRLLTLLPELWTEYRDRGLTHAELGHADLALDDLNTYITNVIDSHDHIAMIARMEELKSDAR